MADPAPSFIGRLLDGATAALAEPAPDFELPPFPWLLRNTDGNDMAPIEALSSAAAVGSSDAPAATRRP